MLSATQNAVLAAGSDIAGKDIIMSESVCPSCNAQVKVKGAPKIGMRAKCESCDTELEVVWLDPLELDWPMEDFEDEEDFDPYYEEDEY